MADFTPESRAEEILYDTINGVEYTGLPESRIEELLLELKAVIEAGGGGGGGTDNYNALKNRPTINNDILQGNVTLGEGLNYNSSTKTVTVSQQSVENTVTEVLDDSIEGYIEDSLPNNMATDSEIDDLFND